MKKRLLAALLYSTAACLYASSSFVVESSNLISCQGTGYLNSRCEVTAINIASDMGYELSYDIDFIFYCPGHRAGIGFFIDDHALKGPFYSAEKKQRAQGINSFKSLVPGALDKDSFYKAQFTSCRLEILAVNKAPSLDTLKNWQEEASYQARLIEKSIGLYLLAYDFEAYQSWDQQKTKMLLESVDRKLTAFEQQCEEGDDTACRSRAHFLVIRNSLKARLDSAPNARDPQADEVENFVQHYLEELYHEVAIGQEILSRFDIWELEAEKSLKAILESLPVELI